MNKNILLKVLAAATAATAHINGRSYSGNNIQIKGNTVIVDGVVQDGTLEGVGPISVTIDGDVDSIDTMSGDVSVKGAVDAVKTVSGDVECGHVGGNITTVSGDVDCSGSVNGNVTTMSGDIDHS